MAAEQAAPGLGLTVSAQVKDTVLFDFLEDMAAVLVDAGITAPIFTGWQPDSPDTLVTLYEYAGEAPATLVQIENPGLQARIRQAAEENDYQKCKMLANAVMAALHDKKNFAGSRAVYIHITAQQSPIFLQRDVNNRPEFVINFIVKKTRN